MTKDVFTLDDIDLLRKAGELVGKTGGTHLCEEIHRYATQLEKELYPEPKDGSVVLDCQDRVWVRYRTLWYPVNGSSRKWEYLRRYRGPLRVLYTPGDPDPADVVQLSATKVGEALRNHADFGRTFPLVSLATEAYKAHEAKFGGGQS